MSDSGLFAAVVNRNSGTNLAECVASLCEFLSPDRIVIVDCASTDNSLRRISDSGVHIEKLRKNRGYAGGNNRALTIIRSFGGRIALIINPDAKISPHDAALMAETMQDNRSIGATFPVIRKANHPKELEAAFGRINYRHRLVQMVGEKALERKKLSRTLDVDFGIGCCFCVRVSSFFKVGGFDEKFFAYHDEPDLCERLRRSNLRTVLMPGVSALHKGVTGNKKRQMAKEYFVARNSVLFMKKYGGIFQWIKFLSFMGLALCVYIPMSIKGNRNIRWRLKGFSDGFGERPIRPEILDSI